MEGYKQEFIEFMVDCGVLKFGEFTLKSGRKSPNFNTSLSTINSINSCLYASIFLKPPYLWTSVCPCNLLNLLNFIIIFRLFQFFISRS